MPEGDKGESENRKGLETRNRPGFILQLRKCNMRFHTLSLSEDCYHLPWLLAFLWQL